MNPLDLLNRARKVVPFLDYAFAVVGLSAAGALIAVLTGYSKLSLITIALVFIAAIVVYAVAGLANVKQRLASAVILWAVIIFFLTFLGFTVSSFATGYPCNWATFLGIEPGCHAPVVSAKASRAIVEGNTVTAFAGGRGEPNPGCQSHTATSCVTPKSKGGQLVKGSGFAKADVQDPTTSTVVTQDTPDQICIKFVATTGACETRVTISGRASAVEESLQ